MAKTITAPTTTSEGGPGLLAGALTGLLTTGVALSAGHAVAAFTTPAASPTYAVGETLIDLTPQWLKEWAIRTFGSNDKHVLVAGIYLVVAILGTVLGITSRRRRWVGLIGLGALWAVGVTAAIARPTATAAWAIPSLVAGAAGFGAFVLLTGSWSSWRLHTSADQVEGAPRPLGFDRRRFIGSAFALGATVALAGGVASYWGRRRALEAGRSSLAFPRPASTARPLPAGAQLRVPGITQFYTGNDRFYRVDTALFVPMIDVKSWKLQIHGMVDRPMTLTFEDLVARPLIERDVTLNCVSNPVGGHFIGNARWIGTPLKPLLEEVGVRSGATQIVTRSVDGFTVGTPTTLALDGRDAMLAVAMNGQPLPFEHGFPVRMLVPGLYGYESATKWIVDMELTTLEAFKAYWVKRGWVQQVPVKTSSRIDTPAAGAKLSPGQVTVAGVAWAQDRGIRAVEVQADGGEWQPATLAEQDTIDTWRQWRWTWNATAGDHQLAVRAIDDTGMVQIGASAPPFPSGATGYHTIEVQIA